MGSKKKRVFKYMPLKDYLKDIRSHAKIGVARSSEEAQRNKRLNNLDVLQASRG